jgi:YggT family protein
MQYQRVPFGNPIGRFVFAVTDWLVLPLRKVLPAVRRVDTASVVAALATAVVHQALLLLMVGRGWELLPLLALLGLVRLVVSSLIALVILYAILSWIRADSPVGDVVDRLCAPLLRPFRRVIPLVGGIDLSPLALLVVLQVISMLVG